MDGGSVVSWPGMRRTGDVGFMRDGERGSDTHGLLGEAVMSENCERGLGWWWLVDSERRVSK